MPLIWTAEALSARSTEDVKAIRENARRKENHDVVRLCDAELERRKSPKKPKVHRGVISRADQYVCEFHFVCPNELGVVKNADGTLWTKTWVVAESHAEAAVKYGACVALHAKKAEASYLQGPILSWRKAPREARYGADQLVQTEMGIDFQFMPSNDALIWQGDATGEKGYLWREIPK
ncbi:MAG: hypothetical protein J0H17_20695 [Rhizobiales bacterium]|jgi:hypothetical protein|nr:hypothetical protein [Hyphomicrobiales bacterium]